MYTCIQTHSACVLVDSAGGSVGVTVYNLAQTAHFAIGDLLTIPDPLLRHTVVQEQVRSLLHNY